VYHFVSDVMMHDQFMRVHLMVDFLMETKYVFSVTAFLTHNICSPILNQGISHLIDIFGRMGFNLYEIVVLSGAHALGKYSYSVVLI